MKPTLLTEVLLGGLLLHAELRPHRQPGADAPRRHGRADLRVEGRYTTIKYKLV